MKIYENTKNNKLITLILLLILLNCFSNFVFKTNQNCQSLNALCLKFEPHNSSIPFSRFLSWAEESSSPQLFNNFNAELSNFYLFNPKIFFILLAISLTHCFSKIVSSNRCSNRIFISSFLFIK